MLKTIDHHIRDLLNFHPQRVDLSLIRIKQLLHALGDPQNHIPPVIHIAGTNGKGSATAFTRAILEASGYLVHVYTSPHLVHWQERYRIAGNIIDPETLYQALQQVCDANHGKDITVFEILTATAFLLFSQYPADVTIIEVGLGGRFDATNVIDTPAAALIMPISLDHQSFLGETIEEIAAEKAGIMKKRSPVIIAHQKEQKAQEILLAKAHQLNVKTIVYGEDFQAYEESGRMIFQTHANDHQLSMNLPLPALLGSFQIKNAAAALAAILAANFQLEEKIVAKAMTKVNWPARMQQLTHGKLTQALPENSELWLDGGHNPAAGQELAAFLIEKRHQLAKQWNFNGSCHTVLICGMINSKDCKGYLASFTNSVDYIATVPVSFSQSSIESAFLSQTAQELNFKSQAFSSIEQALDHILQNHNTDSPLLIIIAGSLYLAGEVLQANATLPS